MLMSFVTVSVLYRNATMQVMEFFNILNGSRLDVLIQLNQVLYGHCTDTGTS